MNNNDDPIIPVITNIPAELYRQIHGAVPIPCVDIVLKKEQSFLLALRKNKPAQGQWWFPGGRVFKGERLVEAVERKLLQEIGLSATIEKVLGVDETMFVNGPFEGPTHTINTVFLATLDVNNDTVMLDSQNSEYQWFTHIDDTWPTYVKKFLALSGFTYKNN